MSALVATSSPLASESLLAADTVRTCMYQFFQVCTLHLHVYCSALEKFYNYVCVYVGMICEPSGNNHWNSETRSTNILQSVNLCQATHSHGIKQSAIAAIPVVNRSLTLPETFHQHQTCRILMRPNVTKKTVHLKIFVALT